MKPSCKTAAVSFAIVLLTACGQTSSKSTKVQASGATPGPLLTKAIQEPGVLDQYPCPEGMPEDEEAQEAPPTEIPVPPVEVPPVEPPSDLPTGEPEAGLAKPAKGSKVLVCHIPPGSPRNRGEICIARPAVAAHLKAHGPNEVADYLGSCF